MSRLFPVLISFLALFLGSFPIDARPHLSPVLFLENPLVRIEVLDAEGEPQKISFRHGRLVTDLIDGKSYALRITNLNDRRVKVVVSIDGINPRDGTRAYRGQPGLVLPPGASKVIDSGRPSRRSPEVPLLPLKPEVGKISLLTTRESGSYPLMGVGYPPAPRDPESFRLNAKGEREWIPPHGYPFRRDPATEGERTYMEYEVVPSP